MTHFYHTIYTIIILLFFILTLTFFILIGIFGGRYRENGFDEIPRGNFNSMAWALLTVFQVITGENWNEVMLTHMQIDPVSILYI